MDSVELLRILGNKYNAEILQATHEPKSAQTLSDELEIPIATSYRRIEELTSIDVLELAGKEFSEEGRRTKVYRRNVDAIKAEFENGSIQIAVEERDEPRNSLVDVWTHLQEDGT